MLRNPIKLNKFRENVLQEGLVGFRKENLHKQYIHNFAKM